ncbi:MAG: hypothetical protein AB3N23_22595 [Paracoccaceae bacterium]
MSHIRPETSLKGDGRAPDRPDGLALWRGQQPAASKAELGTIKRVFEPVLRQTPVRRAPGFESFVGDGMLGGLSEGEEQPTQVGAK